MSKKPKERCKHGLSPVYMQGCPHCVQMAMGGLHIQQDNGLNDHRELLIVLVRAFPTKELWDAALVKARAEIEQDRKSVV